MASLSRQRAGIALILVRSIVALLCLSAGANIFYHSHLPLPTHELVHQIVVAEEKLVEQFAGKELMDDEGPIVDKESAPVVKEPPPVSPHVVPANTRLLWKDGAAGQQVVKKDKHGNNLHRNIHALKNEDISAIGSDTTTTTHLTLAEATVGREPLVAILRDAGVTEMDADSVAQLPTWQQVVNLYGEGPVVVGLDTCQRFRDTIPSHDASIGPAGLFNTGTNPFAMYLAANCKMPENVKEKSGGMRWQVRWLWTMLFFCVLSQFSLFIFSPSLLASPTLFFMIVSILYICAGPMGQTHTGFPQMVQHSQTRHARQQDQRAARRSDSRSLLLDAEHVPAPLRSSLGAQRTPLSRSRAHGA